MEMTCWTCGHWMIGLGCHKESITKFVVTKPDYLCSDWVEEGAKGTITDYDGLNQLYEDEGKM